MSRLFVLILLVSIVSIGCASEEDAETEVALSDQERFEKECFDLAEFETTVGDSDLVLEEGDCEPKVLTDFHALCGDSIGLPQHNFVDCYITRETEKGCTITMFVDYLDIKKDGCLWWTP